MKLVQKPHFYSHLINTESLVIELDRMGFTKSQREHLIALIDSNLHHTVLELVLSELSEDDKKIFLGHVAKNEHDKIWELLDQKVDNIEEKIIKAGNELKEVLDKDIKETKNKD